MDLWQALQWEEGQDDVEKSAFQLVTADTAKRIRNILEAAPSLAGRAPAHLSAAASPIAFKTGTSYGYRDAWAAGRFQKLYGRGLDWPG